VNLFCIMPVHRLTLRAKSRLLLSKMNQKALSEIFRKRLFLKINKQIYRLSFYL
jgi:hypothetical protein